MTKKVLKRVLSHPAIAHLPMFFSKISPNEGRAVFDGKFYRENYPDLAESGGDPFVHFLRHGFEEGRRPNAQISEDYVHNRMRHSALVGQNLNQAYLSSGLSQKPRLLFVSHDATRTGAPAILLRLLQMFSENGAFECFSILDEGGDRLAEFEAASHVHIMSRFRYDKGFSDKDAQQELASFLDKKGIFEGNRPVCAIVNSAESHRIGKILSELGIPVVSLIHEIAGYYQPTVFESFSHLSKKLVFPSQFVKEAATRHCKKDLPNVVVRGQGLLQDGFGSLDRSQCRKMLREELQIEDDAFVVLNVGTKDIRKGADLFVELAAIFKKCPSKTKPVYFVWYGGADKDFGFVETFMKQHNLEDCVRLMPPTSEIERIFMGADVFLLTARADPFPCVIHEAMACGLPVIAFENGGGAPELVGSDCGVVVGMANLARVAEAIQVYLDTPEIHQEHARNAREKIANNWSFWDYHNDIYDYVKASSAAPKGGWPVILPPVAPTHLFITQGTPTDLALIQSRLENSANTDFEIALIGGRFCREIDQTVEKLQALGYKYSVYQPRTDSDKARREIVGRLLKTPRPHHVEFINTLRFVAADYLKTLSYPMSATLTSETVSIDDLYLMLLHLDRFHVSDRKIFEKLCGMNPLFASKIEFVEQPNALGKHP